MSGSFFFFFDLYSDFCAHDKRSERWQANYKSDVGGARKKQHSQDLNVPQNYDTHLRRDGWGYVCHYLCTPERA